MRFVDGTSGVVDLNRLVFGANPGVFGALQDPSVFSRVTIDHGVVSWPDGLDLAPDAMYEAIARSGVWAPE